MAHVHPVKPKRVIVSLQGATAWMQRGAASKRNQDPDQARWEARGSADGNKIPVGSKRIFQNLVVGFQRGEGFHTTTSKRPFTSRDETSGRGKVKKKTKQLAAATGRGKVKKKGVEAWAAVRYCMAVRAVPLDAANNNRPSNRVGAEPALREPHWLHTNKKPPRYQQTPTTLTYVAGTLGDNTLSCLQNTSAQLEDWK